MKSCKIEALHKLVDLESLSLPSDAIQLIEPGSFRVIGNLVNFNRENYTNQIKARNSTMIAIEPNVFAHLPKLKILNLRNCNIDFIDRTAFDNLVNIDELNLEKNNLRTFETKCTPRKVSLKGNMELKSIKFAGDNL